MQENRCISFDQALDGACRQAAASAQRYGRSVLLVENFQRVALVKRCLASLNCGFGVQVETVSTWIEDLWQLYGTGQQLVSSLPRQMLVRKVLRQREEAGGAAAFPEAEGIVRLVARLLRDCAPFFLDRSDAPTPVFSEAEAEVVVLVRDCVAQQREAGAIEPSLACWLLAQQQVSLPPVVLWNVIPSAAQTLLVDRAPAATAFTVECCESAKESRHQELSQLSANLYHPNYAAPLVPQGQVRFVLPMGSYASPWLLTQQVQQLAREGNTSIALSCADPYQMFCRLAPALEAKGVGVRMKGNVPLARTAFGVAWTSLMRFMLDGSHYAAALATDFALSAFSFMSFAAAQRTDASLRGWRGLTLDDALVRVSRQMADEHQSYVEALQEGRFVDALAYQRAWVAQQFRWPAAFRAIQLAALDFALEVQQRALQMGLPQESVLALFDNHAFVLRAQCVPENATSTVTVMTLPELGKQAPASYDACVLADLTADAYSLDEDEQAVDALLKNLGCFREPRKVERLRAAFSCGIAAARQTLLLHRPLKDAAAEDLRPSALFEELVDCYRADPQNPKELNEGLGISHNLVPFAVSRGEEAMTENCAFSGEMPGQSGEYQMESLFDLGQNPPALLLPTAHEARNGQQPHLSASAIEAYLECPFKWFTQRRLGLSSLDAQIDARAKGNFAHAVLRTFHDSLREAGHDRVTPENCQDALVLFQGIFDARLEQEKTRQAQDAFFPLNHKEALEIQRFATRLKDFISWEARFLPAFHPLEGEIHFGYEGECLYAGHRLVGSVDRVDVDAAGNGVILDYKGSVGSHYNFRLKDADASEVVLPQKVQALIYAQIIRRELGLNPVGALYLSYGKALGCAGLYDATRLDPQADLLKITSVSCETTAFLDTLDRVEELVAAGLEGMAAGCVEPQASEEACKYCSVAAACEAARAREGRC